MADWTSTAGAGGPSRRPRAARPCRGPYRPCRAPRPAAPHVRRTARAGDTADPRTFAKTLAADPAGGSPLRVWPLRVLIFHGYLLQGTGSNVYNAELAAALVRAGHEVHLLCQDRAPLELDWVDAAGDWDGGALAVHTRSTP